MPVVAVDDIRLEIFCYVLDSLQNSFREESDSFCIIKFTVNLAALEVVLIIEKVILDSALHQSVEPAVLISPPKSNLIAGHWFHSALILFRNRANKRQNYSDVVLIVLKMSRQGPGYISEAAGLYEW